MVKLLNNDTVSRIQPSEEGVIAERSSRHFQRLPLHYVNIDYIVMRAIMLHVSFQMVAWALFCNVWKLYLGCGWRCCFTSLNRIGFFGISDDEATIRSTKFRLLWTNARKIGGCNITGKVLLNVCIYSLGRLGDDIKVPSRNKRYFEPLVYKRREFSDCNNVIINKNNIIINKDLSWYNSLKVIRVHGSTAIDLIRSKLLLC